MKILIIDGQGGGMGRILVEEISRRWSEQPITVVGTNAMATNNMLKGGTVNAATGENAVVFNSNQADIIIGPIGIIMANAMFGEITPKMAEAVTKSNAQIILIPVNRCRAKIVGIIEKKVSEYIEEALMIIKNIIEEKEKMF